MTPRALAVVLCTLANLALATLASAPVCAEIPAGRLVAPNGYPKDFSLVKRDGRFHVFYIEAGPQGDFNYLGHQTSADLYHWTLEPNVLVADRSDWNPDFVWAPSIVERDGTYWMFYTGVRRRPEGGCPGAPYQQIGVATSTDLTQWTMEPESWLDPGEVPWALQPLDSCTYASFGGFRDPYVVWDPATDQWLMLYVTVPSPDSTLANVPHPGSYNPDRFVVGLGRAPAAFATDSDWTNLGALWITHAAFPGGPAMTTWESPHVFRRAWQGEDLWFLFASTGRSTSVEGVYFMTGPSLTLSRFQKKGRTGWTWRGHIGTLQMRDQYGQSNSTFGWFATEYFRDPETNLEYFANVSIPTLEFRQLKWRTTDYGFDLEQPFAVKEIVTQPSSVRAGQVIDVELRARNANDGAGPKVARLEVLRVDVEGESLSVVAPAEVGLPDSVVIISDVTHVTWIARSPASPPLRLRLRLAAPATEVQSQVVTLWGPDGGAFDRPGDGSPMESSEPALPRSDGLSVHALGAPGSAPVLALQLPGRSVVKLVLYDLRGRRVRRLLERELPRGASNVTWDARDESGARLPAGVYFVRFETTFGTRSARLVLL